MYIFYANALFIGNTTKIVNIIEIYDNFTRTYENVISKNHCRRLINMFEADSHLHEIQDNGNGATLTQLHLKESPTKFWIKEVKNLENLIFDRVQQYMIDCDIHPKQWPASFDLEPPKMKRYLPGTTDEFPLHVDVTSYVTARRFLVAFIYLSDNENASTMLKPYGEETEYKCRRGSMLLFPPMWPWRHAGRRPIHNKKYIIGSYLHYP